MPYERETLCLGRNEIEISQGTDRDMVRNMCGVKLVDMKSTKYLIQMLDLNETLDQLVKTNSVRWYGHVLNKDEMKFLRWAFDIRVKWTRKRGGPKKTWLKTVA